VRAQLQHQLAHLLLLLPLLLLVPVTAGQDMPS
jgi:hypothetical protein